MLLQKCSHLADDDILLVHVFLADCYARGAVNQAKADNGHQYDANQRLEQNVATLFKRSIR